MLKPRLKASTLTRLAWPAIFSLILLAAGFLAEYFLYSKLSEREAGYESKEATRVLVLGGSIANALEPSIFRAELEKAHPGRKFAVTTHIVPMLSSAQASLAFRQLRQEQEFHIVLLLVGCNEDSAPGSEEVVAFMHDNAVERWDASLANKQFARLKGLIHSTLLHRSRVLLDQIVQTIDYEKLAQLSPMQNKQLAEQIRNGLDRHLHRQDPHDAIDEDLYLSLLSIGFLHQQATSLAGPRNPFGGSPALPLYEPVSRSIAYEYLKALDAWVSKGLREISRQGCPSYLKESPATELYARYWLCDQWKKAKGSASALFNDEMLAFYFTLDFKPKAPLRPEKLKGPFAPKFAQAINGRHEPSRVKMKNLSRAASLAKMEDNLRTFVAEARESGTAPLLLHYPERIFPTLESAAARLGISTIKTNGIFPPGPPETIYDTYFVDYNSCGTGHLNRAGAIFYSRRVAMEIARLKVAQ